MWWGKVVDVAFDVRGRTDPALPGDPRSEGMASRMRPGGGAVVGREELAAGAYEVEVVRKRIKRAYLRVDDPDGPVRVSAPAHMPRADIVAFVGSHSGWIERRRAELRAAVPSSPRRGHVADDGTVMLWGEPRALAEVDPWAARLLRDGPEGAGALRADRSVVARLRAELARRAEPLVRAWEPVMGVRVNELRYRDMQTRWGTCSVSARRVWLAVSLAHFPPDCLELIVVHELCHLLETGHGSRFKGLMDRFLPDWRARDALLKDLARGR